VTNERNLNESVTTLIDLLTRPEFLNGVWLGILGLVTLVAIKRFTRGQYGWGVVLACAVVAGIQTEISWQPELLVGIGLMGVGGWLRGIARQCSKRKSQGRFIVAWLLIITGAVLASRLGQDFQHSWVAPVTALSAAAIGWSLSKWENRPDRSALGPLFAVSAFGIWTTVPDTDLARILLGAALPMAFATTPLLAARVFSTGGFALGGTVASLPLWGGEQRPASVVGAWACIGMIALVPLTARLLGTQRIAMWQLAGLHIIAVIVAARVIGLWDRAIVAAIGSTLLAAALVVVLMLIGREQAPSE
jgi:hypothetical protein